MDQSKRLTFGSLMLELRTHLLEAIKQGDQAHLARLMTTFAELQEASYISGDQQAISLLVAFEDAARDALMGVSWKSEIPTEVAVAETFR